jgi:hypothetical protein
LAKVPVPLEVQTTLVWLSAVAPVVMFTAPVEEQVVTLVPATITIGLAKVNVLFEVTLTQGAVAFAVNVNVKLPKAISAALGV